MGWGGGSPAQSYMCNSVSRAAKVLPLARWSARRTCGGRWLACVSVLSAPGAGRNVGDDLARLELREKGHYMSHFAARMGH